MPESLIAGRHKAPGGFAQWYGRGPEKPRECLALNVKVPPDAPKAATGCFYLFWCGNSAVRVGTNGYPAVPWEQLRDTMNNLSSVVSDFEKSGLAFSGLEGAIAVKDLVVALRDERRAANALAETSAAHQATLQCLGLYRQKQIEVRSERHEQQAKQALLARAMPPVQCHENRGGDAAPIEADPVQPQADDIVASGAPDDEDPRSDPRGSRDAEAMRQPSAAAAEVAYAEAKQLFSSAHCDGYLAHVGAEHKQRKSMIGVWSNIIACLRDFGVQGTRVAVEVLRKVGVLVLPELAGHLLGFIASGVMGLFHTGAAIFDWRRANRDRELADEVLRQTHLNKTACHADEKRRFRLRAPFAATVIERFQTNIDRAGQNAKEQRLWAIARLVYGLLSTGLGTAAVVGGVVFGIAVVTGTGGAIFAAIGIAAGVAWLGFAVFKTVKRILAERAERKQIQAAIETDKKIQGKGGMKNCTFERLSKAAARHGALQQNSYFHAAMLAKALLIESEHQGQATKKDRLDASTTLQTIGMTKEMTSLLKRGSFEQAHETIYTYLHGDASQHAIAAGRFNRIAEGSMPNV